MSQQFRDWTLFFAALVLNVLGILSVLEDSVPGFIAGYGTALAIAAHFLARGMDTKERDHEEELWDAQHASPAATQLASQHNDATPGPKTCVEGQEECDGGGVVVSPPVGTYPADLSDCPGCPRCQEPAPKGLRYSERRLWTSTDDPKVREVLERLARTRRPQDLERQETFTLSGEASEHLREIMEGEIDGIDSTGPCKLCREIRSALQGGGE